MEMMKSPIAGKASTGCCPYPLDGGQAGRPVQLDGGYFLPGISSPSVAGPEPPNLAVELEMPLLRRTRMVSPTENAISYWAGMWMGIAGRHTLIGVTQPVVRMQTPGLIRVRPVASVAIPSITTKLRLICRSPLMVGEPPSGSM